MTIDWQQGGEGEDHMLVRTAFIALAVATLSTTAFAADPVGEYKIAGHNPGGDGEYSGTADVTQTGKTYKVVWHIAGETYVGTALGNDDFLAISYKSGDNTGLAMYSAKGDNWEGIWTYAGGTTIGIEAWTRQ